MQDFRLYLLKKGLRPATIELYLKALKPLQDKKPQEIKAHIDQLLITGKSASYINSVTRACILYGEFTACEELSTLKLIPNKKKTLKVTLTDEQIEAMLILPKPRTTSEQTWEKWQLFFACSSYCGFRSGEVASLKWVDLLLEQGKIAIRNSKTASGIRFAPIPPALGCRISAYVEKFNLGHCRGSQAYIFGSDRPPRSGEWSSAFRQRKKMLGITNPYVTAHSLRHSFATRWLQNMIPFPIVQKAMGHSDPQSTLVYTHMVTADVEKAMIQDPLNSNHLTPEQIISSFERVFDDLVKRFTHKIEISYIKTSTGLKIEVKKPA